MMTLREVCTLCGVTRRAVQGYEKMGLVTPSGRNESGHLLYDEIRQQRILYIKKWQDIGFSLREIQELIDAEPEIKRRALELQICRLQERQGQITELIRIATEMME